jgi:hypothetical protein
MKDLFPQVKPFISMKDDKTKPIVSPKQKSYTVQRARCKVGTFKKNYGIKQK